MVEYFSSTVLFDNPLNPAAKKAYHTNFQRRLPMERNLLSIALLMAAIVLGVSSGVGQTAQDTNPPAPTITGFGY